jgi:hypothetical protein
MLLHDGQRGSWRRLRRRCSLSGSHGARRALVEVLPFRGPAVDASLSGATEHHKSAGGVTSWILSVMSQTC